MSMSNRKWLVAGGLLIASLGGCSPDPTIRAATTGPVAVTEGTVVVTGAHMAPSHAYYIGVHTFWSPELVGLVRSDPFGNIRATRVEYSCAFVIGAPIDVGFYREDGLAVVQTTANQICTDVVQPAPPVAHPTGPVPAIVERG
jgi:hypothetical protein